MVKAYYKNSRGEVLWLTKAPFRTVEADWFDSTWEEKDGGYEKTITIDVFGKRSEFIQNMEILYKVISVDSETGNYGRLYVNDTFLPCQIYKTKKTGWKGYVYTEVELTFLAPELSWISVLSKRLYPQKEAVSDIGLDFPTDFPFDFVNEKKGYAEFEIDHITSSEFEMVVYGPCTNPKVLINGYPYEVLTTLESNEYLVINSTEQTITKYMSNGTTANMFDARGYDYSVFEKIPTGLISVSWSGDFGIDLYVFLRRREAAW
jgi:hypothetical protein|nr:MAG TPA: tail protein [Caudoviricetes sp.]